MRILIVGNDPHDVGGVANYTRPLALRFAALGHSVFYFYSGAWNRRYNWLMKPYLRVNERDFPFECAEVVNSPNWAYNFGNPGIDARSPWTERIFADYLDRTKPDVLHVHSRLGLPVSVIEVASRRGIRVFNTIHVYGLLCQKRVMIDREGMPCGGPSNLEKCAGCTGSINAGRLKLAARIENTNKALLEWILGAKKRVGKLRRGGESPGRQGSTEGGPARTRIDALKRRLEYAVRVMNDQAERNICVSADVKKILMRFGVRENKLLVQHIGSTIAERQTRSSRRPTPPLVVGNIGGVGYYKGTHVLIDAAARIRGNGFVVKIFGKYDGEYVNRIMERHPTLSVEFLGRYSPEDLHGILRQIDIMVLPSICSDTAPQTIFESYSAGIPIIASDIGGFPDFIRDGHNGFLFRPGDGGALAHKLEQVLADPGMLETFSGRIPPLKTLSENAKELIALYGGCSAIH